jgi:signal transduction histidine kinase
LTLYRNFITIVFVVILVLGVFAQDQKTIDSIKKDIVAQTSPELLMQSYFDLAKQYVFLNYDSAIVYYNQAIGFANEVKNKKLVASVYLNLSKLQAKMSYFTESQKNCNRAIEIATEINDDSLYIVSNVFLAKILITGNNFTNVLEILEPTLAKAEDLNDSMLISECYEAYGTYYFFSDVPKAIDYYIKSMSIVEKSGDSQILLSGIINIGSLYGMINQFEKSIEYLLKGADLAEKTGQEYVKSTVYNNLAVIYFEMGDNTKSKFYLEKALELAYKLNDEPMICGILVNLGEIYQKDKQYDLAMDYYLKGLNNPAINNIPDQKIYTLHNISTVYYDLMDFRNAIKHAEMAVSIAKNLNIIIHNVELYKVLAESYEQINDFKTALENHKLYKIYNDSLFNIQSTEKIAEIQSKYDFEAAENENDLLKKDNQIQALTIEKQKIRQLLLVILLFIIMITIVLIYLRMKKNQKVNVLLSAKNEEIHLKSEELKKANAAKDKFFSILAHDLRNPFNSILNSLNILQHDYDKLSENERVHFIQLIHKTTQSTNNLLANLLEWSITQRGGISIEKRSTDIASIIKESVILHHQLAVQKEISIENQIPEKTFAFIDKKTITITINNLLSNAIKFTPKKGKINISSITTDKYVNIVLKDTGIGIPPNILESLFKIEYTNSRLGTDAEPGTGLGLILCNEFIKQNNGNISITSEVGFGSSFEISLPVSA